MTIRHLLWTLLTLSNIAIFVNSAYAIPVISILVYFLTKEYFAEKFKPLPPQAPCVLKSESEIELEKLQMEKQLILARMEIMRLNAHTKEKPVEKRIAF